MLSPKKNLLSKVLLAISLAMIFISAHGQRDYTPQQPDPVKDQWRYAYYPEIRGQGIRDVMCSDQSGLCWFALDSGAMSYDGYEWTLHDPESGLVGGSVHKVFVSETDEVFAATSLGVFQLIRKKWQNLLNPTDSLGITITSIRQLYSGAIVCTSNFGLFYFSSKGHIALCDRENIGFLKPRLPDMTFVEIPRALIPTKRVDAYTDFCEISPGRIWLDMTYAFDESGDILSFSEHELLRGNLKNYTLLSEQCTYSVGSENRFLNASDGSVWIISKVNHMPLLRFANGRWSQTLMSTKFGDDEYAESITETVDGSIWISGIGVLFRRKPDGQWVKYNSGAMNIPQGHILLAASGSDLWVLGYLSSVFKIDLSKNRWLTYQGINYMDSQQDGTHWFLEVNGRAVAQRPDGKWIIYDQKTKLIDDPVAIYVSEDDHVWTIGSNGGVAAAGHLQNGKWENRSFPSLSWGFDYRGFHSDNNGDVWLAGCTDIFFDRGQTGGLIQIKKPYGDSSKIVYHRSRNNGLEQLNAYGIAQSANDHIWIGGTDLNFFDGKKWGKPQNPNMRGFINIVENDVEGSLYVGSRRSGLFILKNNQWTHFSAQNGLQSNNIISLETDTKLGTFWVATDQGFGYFNGTRWTNGVLPAGLALTYEGGSIKKGAEGLWINHSPREWKRRAYTQTLPDRSVTANYNTYRFKSDGIAPETKIELFEEEVDASGNTSVFWSARHYFNRTPKEDLFFSYKLNDSEWSPFTSQISHTFLGLADGDYQLEVRSMDSEGNIDPSPAKIAFVVKPPVWKQGWFIMMIICFLAILSVFQYQILRKRKVLQQLNSSLQKANESLGLQNEQIEEQKNSLEEALEEINELSQAKMKFFTNITHEFRIPLSLIIGPIDKLLKEAPKDTTLQGLYGIIKKNGLRLQKLINQLLEIRRIETGNLKLKLESADLISFVQDIKTLFDGQAADRNIMLGFASSVPRITMFFDRDKIEKIMFNLISNAFKHTDNADRIQIKIELAEQDRVRLVVSDNGRGMTRETQAHIFERFVIGGDETAHGESSGIGLSYTRDLVDIHFGRIAVQSELGQGSTFTVELPTNLNPDQELTNSGAYDPKESIEASILQEESKRVAAVESQAQSQAGTILIAEDNADMIYFIKHLLANDYSILEATNGIDALAILREQYVDLVICDVMMPKMDGMEFLQQMKSDQAISHIPVILLTALVSDEQVVSGYQLGADSYLVKPFNPDTLLARIKNLMDSRAALRGSYQEDLKFKPKNIEVSSIDEEFLKKLSELIEQNVADSSFDVSKLCGELNMSHMQFIRKVKQLTGKKPNELLKTYRMTMARDLLKNHKIPVSKVGFMVGYDVPNSFTRAFKAEFGLSPTAYVQSLSEN
jgi:signal transduction histidine kinase/DNA-binding response OmpR family regulator/ligand-binding sensor domain-containing protein